MVFESFLVGKRVFWPTLRRLVHHRRIIPSLTNLYNGPVAPPELPVAIQQTIVQAATMRVDDSRDARVGVGIERQKVG